jgi:hypothetical protein
MLPEQQCGAGGHSSSWTERVWRFALAALVSISLGLIQVLVLMIPRKRGANEKLDASTAAIPEDFLLVDIFAACFTTIPAGDWCRTWAADRTIMLRMTSKRFKELVDKLRPPVFVRWSLSFLEDERNGPAAEKLKLVFKQLAALLARSRITKLDTRRCTIKGQDAKRLAGVLAHCPALTHLNLSENQLRTGGAENLVGVLGQCRALAHLDLRYNQLGDEGVGRFAGVLGQLGALAHLNLSDNEMGSAGAEKLAGVLAQCPALTHLDLSGNTNGPNVQLTGIGADGAKSLAKVLPQCTALTRLDLSDNNLGAAGAESLARVLAQCPALTHLSLAVNQIGEAGAESLAGVLGQCPALARLDLSYNGYNYSYDGMGAVGSGKLRASWLGPASGLLL